MNLPGIPVRRPRPSSLYHSSSSIRDAKVSTGEDCFSGKNYDFSLRFTTQISFSILTFLPLKKIKVLIKVADYEDDKKKKNPSKKAFYIN